MGDSLAVGSEGLKAALERHWASRGMTSATAERSQVAALQVPLPPHGAGGRPAILIEVGLRDPQEGAISLGSQCEDEGLACEHCQLPHQLPRLCHEQTHILCLVDHALVDMQAAPQHKVQAHILWGRGRDGHTGKSQPPPSSRHPEERLRKEKCKGGVKALDSSELHSTCIYFQFSTQSRHY